MTAPSASLDAKEVRGRFAPSPSGRMHLGNLWAALMSWLWAKSKGGKWVLRIEDLDPQRSRREWMEWIESDLLWLGLQWDEGGMEGIGEYGPYLQSQRHDIYEKVLQSIGTTGNVYSCFCTRAEIKATQAPHQSDGRIVYSGRCRPTLPNHTPLPADANLRLYVPDAEIAIDDDICGHHCFNLALECGDFILRRKDGAWAYQLAVVADDADMHITEVVRGNDLLLSAAQQQYLYTLLGLEPPRFIHLPLLCNASGQRLSKRDSSLSCDHLRALHSPAEIIGKLATLAGINPSGLPLTPRDLLAMTSGEGLEQIKMYLSGHPILKI